MSRANSDLKRLIIIIGLLLNNLYVANSQSSCCQSDDWWFIDYPYGAIDYAGLNTDTIILMTGIPFIGGDSVLVYLTMDGCFSFEQAFTFPVTWDYGNIYSSESWGIIAGRRHPNDTIKHCGKEYHILFKDLGEKWRFLEDDNINGCSTELHFISRDTAYFLSHNNDQQQVFGIMWNKGDSIQVIRIFDRNQAPLHNLTAFKGGIGYIMSEDTLLKTTDNFKSLEIVMTGIEEYCFTKPDEGAILTYWEFYFIGKERSQKVPIYCNIGPWSSNLVLINGNRASITSSWPGTSGGVALSTVYEYGQCFLSTIHYQDYGQNHWKLYLPNDSTLYGFSQHTIIKSKSIGEVTHDNVTTANSSISVFPNPCYDDLYLMIDHPQSTIFNVEVIDLMGRTLQNSNFNINGGNNQRKIETSDLDPGIYYLYLEEQQTLSKKILPFIKSN